LNAAPRRLTVNNITIILFLSLVMVGYAQATEPTIITLSCDGTVKTNVGNNKGQRKTIDKVGVVVDLAEQTVSFVGYVAHIENLDATAIFFGSGIDAATGDIDRASGVMSATTMKGNLATSYELFCKPVTRSASRKTK
jgi:hypothetical protein